MLFGHATGTELGNFVNADLCFLYYTIGYAYVLNMFVGNHICMNFWMPCLWDFVVIVLLSLSVSFTSAFVLWRRWRLQSSCHVDNNFVVISNSYFSVLQVKELWARVSCIYSRTAFGACFFKGYWHIQCLIIGKVLPLILGC